jgi:hypothetical protein
MQDCRPGPLPLLPRHHHRLGLDSWVADIAFFMQPDHGLPVEALPGPLLTRLTVHDQIQQGKGRFVDLIFIVFHCAPPFAGAKYVSAERYQGKFAGSQTVEVPLGLQCVLDCPWQRGNVSMQQKRRDPVIL